MTITMELIAIVGVEFALAGVLIPASNRQSREINELRQQVNQLIQQMGHLSGLLEGLRGRPLPAGADSQGVDIWKLLRTVDRQKILTDQGNGDC